VPTNSLTPIHSTPRGTSLICPHTGHSIKRVIVVDQPGAPSDFVKAVALTCKDHGVWPIVLTVADSEDEALCRQAIAVNLFSGISLAADFDYVVGSDICNAVSWAARWRHCHHAIVASAQAAPWWKVWRRGPVGRLLDLSSALTLLTLADNGIEKTIPGKD